MRMPTAPTGAEVAHEAQEAYAGADRGSAGIRWWWWCKVNLRTRLTPCVNASTGGRLPVASFRQIATAPQVDTARRNYCLSDDGANLGRGKLRATLPFA